MLPPFFREDQEEQRGDVRAGSEELVGISEAGHRAEEQGGPGQVPGGRVAERAGPGQRLGGEKPRHVPAAHQEAAAGPRAEEQRQDGEEARQTYPHLQRRGPQEHSPLQDLLPQVCVHILRFFESVRNDSKSRRDPGWRHPRRARTRPRPRRPAPRSATRPRPSRVASSRRT